jgi:hypothetical protein
MLRTIIAAIVCTALGVLIFKFAGNDSTIAIVLGALALLGFFVWRNQG